MKHLKYYRFQLKHTKTHHQKHLKTPQKHPGTPQNTSNHYKNQPETPQNISNRIEMLDFITDYIATPFGPLQKLHRTMTHHCKYHETCSFTKAMTTDASCDSYIEYVLTCV